MESLYLQDSGPGYCNEAQVFESDNSASRDPDVKDVTHIEGDGVGLFDKSNWTLNELSPSVRVNMRLSTTSAFNDTQKRLLLQE